MRAFIKFIVGGALLGAGAFGYTMLCKGAMRMIRQTDEEDDRAFDELAQFAGPALHELGDQARQRRVEADDETEPEKIDV